MEKGILVDFMKEHGKTIVDMLSVEFTEAEIQQLYEENGFERGLKLGREEATERVNKLNQLLIAQDRMEDLQNSIADPAYQQQLFEEFGL